MAKGFPTSADQVDAAFLARVLDKDVVSVTNRPVGNGLVGDSAMFELTYGGSEAGMGPRSLVGKFPAQDQTSRSTAAALRLYEKEVGFYREIAPYVAIRTPKVFFARFDAETADFCLLMEDLGPAKQGDQLDGCSFEEALRCVRELAGLHGPSYASEPLTGLEFLKTSDAIREFTAKGYVGACASFAETYAGTMSDEDLQIVAATGEHSTALWQNKPEGVQAIVHGDFRLDNILFDIRGESEPMATLDWQTVASGNPLIDLGYFIGAGIGQELRLQHGPQLLSEYAKALAEKGGPAFADINQEEGYARGALHGVVTAVYSAAFVEDNERARAIFQSMAEGACSLVREIDALRILEQ